MTRPSRNVIEQTWLAYAFDRPQGGADLEARLQRVGRHYGALIADRVEGRQSVGELTGIALWVRPDERLRWPLWSAGETAVTAMTAVPAGWRRVVGDVSLDAAPGRLAQALLESPRRAAQLTPPFVIGIRDPRSGRLVVVNDVLGAGRLYELRFEGGTVWSNRLGALPIFAGIRPAADPEGWAVFAAAGWFLGKSTPIRDVRKVAPASVIDVTVESGGARVDRRATDADLALAAPRRARFAAAADEAAGQVLMLADDLGAAWGVPIAISLTGGRDSRVSAAAAIGAGIDATYNTGDQVPGEVEVVRELVRRAPREVDHTVYTPEAEADDAGDLLHRVADIHLVHDGMRNPQEVRRPSEVPQRHRPRPTLSGHGGELGHGFYYPDRAKLRRLRRRGEGAILAQLERNARRRHSAANADAYELYLAECERTLDTGRSVGLRGPELLDWFYMRQRLPYRSGLGARSGRSSACVVPAFVRGAFDLSPRQRLRAKLHRAVVARLVPEWRRVDFFRSGQEEMPDIHRRRIWERTGEVEALEGLIAERRGWSELFDAGRIEKMWAEVRSGGGSADYEHVFYRLVWRAAFEDHLETLAAAGGAA